MDTRRRDQWWQWYQPAQPVTELSSSEVQVIMPGRNDKRRVRRDLGIRDRTDIVSTQR